MTGQIHPRRSSLRQKSMSADEDLRMSSGAIHEPTAISFSIITM
jgi:hypothetical protein